MKGFTLLEMLVAVAILAILAAIAVPNLRPMVQIEQLNAATQTVAGFGSIARMRAMTDRRCVRLRIDVSGPGVRDELVIERLNNFDCEDPVAAAAVAANIDGTGLLWIEIERISIEQPDLVVSLLVENSEVPGELRYRPSGRLFSSDTTLTDDDIILRLQHTTLTGASADSRDVLFESHGPICAARIGVNIPGAGNNRSCP